MSVFVIIEQGTYAQGRILAQDGYHFPGLLRMGQ